jgi:hypothetical protein
MYTIDARDVRTLENYDQAAKWEALVKPIRGDKNNTKPLGKRNKKHINIRKENDDILVRLYRTDVVTYKPDGTIILDPGGYSTQSTVKLMYAVLPWGPRPHLFKDRVWVVGEYEDEHGVIHHGKFMVNNKEGATLTYNPTSRNYRILNPDPVYTHRIHIKNKRLATEPYQDFIRWVKAICAVRADDEGNVILGENEKQAWRLINEVADEHMRSGDLDRYCTAFCSVPNWQRWWNHKSGGSVVYASRTAILASIDRHILKTCAASFLDRTQAPWGQQVADRFKGFI